MAELLFRLPRMRQRYPQIYRYNDSILTCSDQELQAGYRFSRASIQFITNLIETVISKHVAFFLCTNNAVGKFRPHYCRSKFSSTFSIKMVIFQSDQSLFLWPPLLSFYCRRHIGNLKGKMHYGMLVVNQGDEPLIGN